MAENLTDFSVTNTGLITEKWLNVVRVLFAKKEQNQTNFLPTTTLFSPLADQTEIERLKPSKIQRKRRHICIKMQNLKTQPQNSEESPYTKRIISTSISDNQPDQSKPEKITCSMFSTNVVLL